MRWATATRRQLDRWEALVAESVRCKLYENQQPAGIVIWEAEAERHLAFVAARNLLRAIDVTQFPVTIAPDVIESIRSIRDLLEHWDENKPVFNVWPHTAQPPRRSGKQFVQRNPNRSPYGQTGWSGAEGPLLSPGLPAAAVDLVLDQIEREVLSRDPHYAEYVSERPTSPWQGEQAGDCRWWPTWPTDLPKRKRRTNVGDPSL